MNTPTPFEWMLNGARKYDLLINENELKRLEINPDPLAKKHNPLIPFWWLLGWWQREIPEGAKIHASVKTRMDMIDYTPPIPSDAVFVE